MGILSDIFVATAEDASQYERVVESGAALDPSRYSRVEYKGLTDLAFGVLWAKMLDEPWDIDRHMLVPVGGRDDGSTWLMEFPAELVGLLADTADTPDSNLCADWGVDEDVKIEPKILESVLRDLRNLAQQAKSEKRNLYLWGSL